MSGRQRGQNRRVSPGGAPPTSRRRRMGGSSSGRASPSSSGQLRAMVTPVSAYVGVPTPLVAAPTVPPAPVAAPGPARLSAGAASYVVSPALLAALDTELLEFAEIPPTEWSWGTFYSPGSATASLVAIAWRRLRSVSLSFGATSLEPTQLRHQAGRSLC